MNMQTIKTGIKAFGGLLAKHSPTILTGFAVAGTISTAVLAARAHVEATKKLDEELVFFNLTENGFESREPTFKEKIKIAWKCYIPPVIMGAATIGCIVGAHSINLHRNAVLAGAYTLAETSLKEFQSKAKEIVGENKVREIKDEIVKDKIEKNPPSKNEIIITGKGETLCYDVYSGRYFASDIEKVRKAVNDANVELFADLRLSLNDMYYALGLTPIRAGADLGWNMNDAMDSLKDYPIEARFSSHLSEENTPCLAIEFHPQPYYI